MPQLATSLERLGTETAFEVLARAKALEATGKRVIHLEIGEPDFDTPPHIVEAAAKALKDGQTHYCPAPGLPILRETCANHLSQHRGIDVHPDSIVVTPGAKPFLFYGILATCNPGDEVIYPNPGFPIYESVIRFSGATPVPMPLKEDKGFAFDADEVLSLVTPRTRLLIVNSPANPTGGTVPREQFDRLVKGLERHPHVAIMSDEIYGQMLYDGREHVSLLSYPSIRDRLILLDGWSKTYAMTGWRLGYSVWPEKLVAQAERLAINCHSCVNASAQYAGLAALEGPQDAVHDMVAAFATRRKVIVRALNQLPGVTCVEPGGAFYAFPNVSGTGLGSREFQDVMLNEAGVAALSGTAFGAHGEGYLRFSYANSVENIEEAMRRIGKLLTERTGKRQ